MTRIAGWTGPGGLRGPVQAFELTGPVRAVTGLC